MINILLIAIFIAAFIAYYWIKGIDYMQKNHPDYKGEDLFGEEDTTKSDTPKE